MNSYQVFQVNRSGEERQRWGGRRAGAGRPRGALNKLTKPVRELAADEGPTSILRLVHLRDHADSEQVQFAAAKELLDRAYGRPRQEFDEGSKTIVVVNRGQGVRPALEDHGRDGEDG